MPDVITKLSDAIIPSVFLPYMTQRTAQKSVFRSSGIVVRDPLIDKLANGAGKTFDMPFWNDIAGPNQVESQILSDSVPLTTKKITTAEQVSIAHGRGEGWAHNSLIKYLTAEDPGKEIAEMIAGYWAIDEQGMLIATADGFFAANAANNAGDLINNVAVEVNANVTGATKISAGALIDAEAKLGDSGANLGAIAMHSIPYYGLRKLDLIDFIPDSESKAQIATYMGKRVIVDDQLYRANTSNDGYVYKTFLFGQGAFMMGEADLGAVPIEGGFGTEALEMARVANAGVNQLYSRRRFILHPHGGKWLGGTLAALSPTNTELATTNNWSRVFEKKNVRVVELLTN